DSADRHRIEIPTLRTDREIEWDVRRRYAPLWENRQRRLRRRVAPADDPELRARLERYGAERDGGDRPGNPPSASHARCFLTAEDSQRHPTQRVEVPRRARHPTPAQQKPVVCIVEQVGERLLSGESAEQPHSLGLRSVGS